ncbi:MAG: hypothetical protein ACXABZ_10765 [Candidatus Thorarchaeota archaeon]
MSEEITGVPYVWQEINGFCFPSALSMVLQGMGLDLSLYDILAASGSGFSMVGVSIDEAMTFYPGVMVRQIPWFEFFTDLYGLDMQFYLDSDTDYGWNAMQILEQWGSDCVDYADSTLVTPRNVMRESIDAGYPLAISVDTFFLPVEDWDITREYIGPMFRSMIRVLDCLVRIMDIQMMDDGTTICPIAHLIKLGVVVGIPHLGFPMAQDLW